jgi:hypothetical protein
MIGIWLVDLLPLKIILLLAPLALIGIGIAVEKNYTGRITLFANAIALITFFASFSIIPLWIVWYANIMTILGIIGFFSYIFKESLFETYYQIGRIGSSAVTGIIILIFALTNLI